MTSQPLTPEDIKALASQLRDTLHEIDQQAEEDYHAEQAAARYQRTSTRVQEMEARIEELRAETKALTDAAARHEKLATLIDFLDGRITHAVVLDGGLGLPMICTADEAFTATGDYGRKDIRLASLAYPGLRPGGQWKLNTYSDGSGSDIAIIPCRSREEAEQALRDQFDTDVARWRAGEDSAWRLGRAEHWRRYAATGVTLPWPADLVNHFNQGAHDSHAKAIADAQATAAKLAATPVTISLDVEVTA